MNVMDESMIGPDSMFVLVEEIAVSCILNTESGFGRDLNQLSARVTLFADMPMEDFLQLCQHCLEGLNLLIKKNASLDGAKDTFNAVGI